MELHLFEMSHKNIINKTKDRLLIKVGNDSSFVNYDYYDGDGDNIHDLNPYFCELTAIYWIWKNFKCDPEDYIGIEHYRRFFYTNQKLVSKMMYKKDVLNILNKKEAIFPSEYISNKTIYEHYKESHGSEDIDLVRKIISDKTPEYLSKYDAVMNGHKTFLCNMMIVKKKSFDEYCAWLFKVLFELEKQIDYKDRQPYQRRVFGFISERLLTVFYYDMDNIYRARVYDKGRHINIVSLFIKERLLRNYYEKKAKKQINKTWGNNSVKE